LEDSVSNASATFKAVTVETLRPRTTALAVGSDSRLLGEIRELPPSLE